MKKTALSTIACLGLLFATGMITTDAKADSCNSPESCARLLTCYMGFSAAVTREGTVCQKKSDADTHTPTCSRFKLKDDWQWSSENKNCYRDKARTTVTSTENIECRSGYTYSSRSGKCEKPADTISAMPVLSTSENPAGTPLTCNNGSDCARKVTCPSGTTRETLGKKYYCKRERKAETATPTCSRFRNKNDWKWSASDKHCWREKKRTTVSSTENISCESGFDYNPSSGYCELPAGVYFGKPTLQ